MIYSKRHKAYYQRNKKKILAKEKLYRKIPRVYKRKLELNRQYKLKRKLTMLGVTQAHLESCLNSQGGACAICGRNRRMVIDHCHNTGKFRAWLCSKCNTVIGLMEENPEYLQQAASYLTKHSAVT